MMDTQWIIFASVLFLDAIVAVGVAILLMRMKEPSPGRKSLAYMLFLLAVWSFGYAMLTLSPSLAEKRFWLRFENIGVAFVPVYWFFVAVRYTHPHWRIDKITITFLFAVPLCALAIIFSDRWFEYHYAAIRLYSENGGPLIIERGPLYFVFASCAYLLHFIGMGLLTWRAAQCRHIYQRQSLVLMGAAFAPVLINLFYQFEPVAIPVFPIRVDLTPLSFTLTAMLLAFGVFNLRLFDLHPIERDKIMEHIPGIVLTLDAQHRVADANGVVLKLLGKSANEIIGKKITELEAFDGWTPAAHLFLETGEFFEIIQIPTTPPRVLEATITPIRNANGSLQGRLITARDISNHPFMREKLAVHLATSSKSLALEDASVADEAPTLNAEFVKMAAFGLRNFSNAIRLGQSPLADYIGATGISHIERGKETQRILREAVESLRPQGERPMEPLPHIWRNFVLLHDAYIQNIPNEEIMARLYVSEATFHRIRQNALQGMALWLIERNRARDRS